MANAAVESSPTPARSKPRPTSRRRLWLFRAAAVLLGLSVFGAGELVCVVFDWGRPTKYEDPFVGFSEIHPLFELDESGDEYRIPPSRRDFFAAESFPADKGERTLRIFCLGGSTVQGRPYSTATSFTTWLELALDAADDRFDWEVVNCGGISYASYRLVPILEECLKYEPDLFLVCTGHNEFLEDRSYEHIKEAPPALAVPQRLASRLRTVALLREGVRRLQGETAQPAAGEVLPAETDPILDYHDSLQAYHRDEDWRRAITAHYEFNLRRMVELARGAEVPLMFMLPPSNLGDCPPLKSEHREGLTEAEGKRWRQLVEEAQQSYRGSAQESLRLLQEAATIDDEHAALWYELGKCYQRFGLHEQAREAFVRARELDVCPLRMVAAMETSLERVAEEEEIPLLNVHELLEDRCAQGILDGSLLIDHVHPTIEAHQMIADALVERLAREGVARPREGWEEEARAAYREHFESLEDFYFLSGERTLEALRAWTQGQADGPPAEGRFPERLGQAEE